MVFLDFMKIYSTLQIGSFHLNHCEDHQITGTIGKNKLLVAVMDGCTMGEESVFASILLGKILKSIARKHDYLDFKTPQQPGLKRLLKEILNEVFAELKRIKNQLGLNTNELLTTLILGVVDQTSCEAELVVIGDGLICADGAYSEFEQGDKPDYLAYHLNEQFEEWYDRHSQFLSIKQFQDLSICTDGIYTFNSLGNSIKRSETAIKAFLLEDRTETTNQHFLDAKMLTLKDEWGHVPGDDIAIVRIIQS